jgi:hypothetical protein
VIRILGRLITIVALCCAIGLHWLALQSIGWTTMMVQNAKRASFCESVKRTFDGAHPCSLCHIVNKGKASEQKREIQTSSAKIDIICAARPIWLLPRSALFAYVSPAFSRGEVAHSPPVPPPRLLA